VNTIELVLFLLVAIVICSSFARRFNVPYPIVLVLVGLMLGLTPGLPHPQLQPDLVLLLFLPPLVYATSWQTSIRELRRNWRPILLLALGLVIFTVLGMATVASNLVGPLTLPAAFILGSIVSPTDTVAAQAIVARLDVPRRIVVVLEGESLINDATGLTTYTFAVAAGTTGAFSPPDAMLRFVVVVSGGIGIGLAVGVVADWVQERFSDPATGVTYSLLIPYAVYLPAQALGVSGVLALVAAGLYAGWREPTTLSADARMQAKAVWSTMSFVVNGLIFILVGLQLRLILDNLKKYPSGELVLYALLVVAVVIVVRVVWVFPATYLPRLLSRRVRDDDPYPGWRNVVILAWTGMRGGVSLAAALALAPTAALPRSQISLITFLVFAVILGTLVVQGLTLAPLIAWLGLADDTTALDEEEATGRLAAMRAALQHLDDLVAQNDGDDEGTAVSEMRRLYQKRADHLAAHLGGTAEDGAALKDGKDPMHNFRALQADLLIAQRRTVIRMRNEGTIGDEALHRIERTLDLEELRL